VHAIITPTGVTGLSAGEFMVATASLACTDSDCATVPIIPSDGVLGTISPNVPMAASFFVSDTGTAATINLNTPLFIDFRYMNLPCTVAPCIPARVNLGPGFPIRCDSVNIQKGYEKGCVYSPYRPTWTVSDSLYPKVGLVAKHMAMATGNLAGHQGLPGLPGYNTPLTYTADETDNRRVACGGKTAPPEEAALGNTTCDEYPLAATKQGAASGDPYSICWVPPEANDSQGGQFKTFLFRNRILEDDDFFVNAHYSGDRSGCDDGAGGGGSATPNNALNSMFNSYGDSASCAEWSGGDATNSVVLPDGERAWFFSDTYLNSPQERKGLWYASALHNSIVVQRGNALRKTITGGNTCQEHNQFVSFWDRYAKTPAAASDGGFFWTGDQTVVGSNVVKFYYHGLSNGSSFVIDYSAVATIPVGSLENDSVVTVNPARFSCGSAGITWGTALLAWNGAEYVYGWKPSGTGSDRVYLAKTSAGGLTSPGSWQLYTGMSGGNPTWGGCGSSPAALPITNGTTGFSVVPVNNSLWLVQFDYTRGQLNAEGTIGAHPATTPWGFGNRSVALYDPPTGFVDYPYYYQQYEARVQPGLGGAGKIVISYNVNTSSVDSGCVSANAHDARIYRPRFIDVPSSAFNPSAATAAAAPSSWAPATLSSNPVAGHGIRHSGPPFPAENPPLVNPSPAAAAATGIDGTGDWYHLPLGGDCPVLGGLLDAPAATVDSHGIVAATWDNEGTDVWYYVWMCDATLYSCSSQGTGSPWFSPWPAGDGNLWTVSPAGFLDPIDLTTSPGVDPNGHRFAFYVRSFGAANASEGGNSPTTTVTVRK
jgi:hypothetical protein